MRHDLDSALAKAHSTSRTLHAKARLSDMQTQEVSLVDNAANLRRFVVVKRDDPQARLVSKHVTKANPISLSPERQRTIMDGLGDALDRLTALASMVSEATTDVSSADSPEVERALQQCADLLGKLAESKPDTTTPEQTAKSFLACGDLSAAIEKKRRAARGAR